MLALVVDHHVQWAIAIPELCNCFAHNLCARLDGLDGELNQWSASIGSQQVRLASNLEGDKGSHRRAGFKSPMCSVVYFHLRAFPDLSERKGDPA